MSAGATPPSALEPVEDLALKVGPPRDDASMARQERFRVLLHSKSFIAGAMTMMSREPTMTRENTSRPSRSVPNQ